MIADMWVGNTATAEWFWVIAIVLFVVAAIMHFVRTNRAVITPTTEGTRRGVPGWAEPILMELGLAFMALGFLVL